MSKRKKKEIAEQKEEIVQKGTNSIEEDINTRKNKFNKKFRTYKVVNIVLIIVSIIVITLCYILLFPIGTNGMWATFIIIAVLIIAIFIYSVYMKRSITKKADKYMNEYYELTSNYVFSFDGIEDYQIAQHEKMSLEDFKDARLIKDVYRTGSRNLVSYKLNNFNYKVSDYIAYRLNNEVSEPMFLGKLMYIDLEKSINGRILIYRHPDKKSLDVGGPDDKDDLTKTYSSEKLDVYVSDEKLAKIVTEEAIKVLEEIQTGVNLADITVSIIDTRITIAMAYGDEIMVVPLKRPFDFDSLEQYKENINAVHTFVNSLSL